MLVQLKKRGELPPHTGTVKAITRIPGGITLFRGCCIEVEKFYGIHFFDCGGEVFRVTDKRVLACFELPKDFTELTICSHYLIDDLETGEEEPDAETLDVTAPAQLSFDFAYDYE